MSSGDASNGTGGTAGLEGGGTGGVGPTGGASGGAGGSAGDPTLGNPDAGEVSFDDSARCNGVLVDGPVVAQEFVAETAPSATGGTIADGTYVLTSAQIYTGPGGPTGPTNFTFRHDIKVTGSMLEEAFETGGNGTRTNYTIAVAGTKLTETWTCPVADTPNLYDFSASDHELIIYGTYAGSGDSPRYPFATIFTKRE